jgi:hypothetical protein
VYFVRQLACHNETYAICLTFISDQLYTRPAAYDSLGNARRTKYEYFMARKPLFVLNTSLLLAARAMQNSPRNARAPPVKI